MNNEQTTTDDQPVVYAIVDMPSPTVKDHIVGGLIQIGVAVAIPVLVGVSTKVVQNVMTRARKRKLEAETIKVTTPVFTPAQPTKE